MKCKLLLMLLLICSMFLVGCTKRITSFEYDKEELVEKAASIGEYMMTGVDPALQVVDLPDSLHGYDSARMESLRLLSYSPNEYIAICSYTGISGAGEKFGPLYFRLTFTYAGDVISNLEVFEYVSPPF